MIICTGENDIQRRTGGIGEEVVLASRLAPISRGGTCFFPMHGPHRRTVGNHSREIDAVSVAQLNEKNAMSLFQAPA